MNKRLRNAIHQTRAARRPQHGRAISKLDLETLEDRHLLASNPYLVAILPNSGDILREGSILNTAPEELVFRFDVNQIIDPNTLGGIRLARSGDDDVFGNGNDVTIEPGLAAIGQDQNEVVIRFKESLPDDLYQISIFGFDDGDSSQQLLTNVDGDAFDADPETPERENLTFDFRLDLGAQILAVVPQPVTRNLDGSLSQARSQIVVYFNNDDLDPELVRNPDFYQLIETNETATNQDDPDPHTPISIAYRPGEDTATLTFAGDIAQLGFGTGTFRLRIGNSEGVPTAPLRRATTSDVGSSFETANNLGNLGSQAIVVASEIEAQPLLLTYPGGNDDPGSRDIPFEGEQHVERSSDTFDGIRTIAYNFKDTLGTDENGNPFFNFITEEQKQRAREAFELWSVEAGIEFVETETSGITIGFGDLRSVDPLETGGRNDGTLFRVQTDPKFEETLVVLDVAEQWDDTFGDNTNASSQSWFRYAMAGIGRAIGLGNASNLPAPTIMATSPPAPLATEPADEIVFPGPHDVTHVQHIHRPDSVDIDLYRFDIAEPGTLTAEIAAQRLDDASMLDSVITVYQQDLDGKRRLIAQNDDYFSEDSFLKLDVQPGTYFVGISSTGNTNYTPAYENSGSGGTTQGRYELRLDFSPIVDNVLRDATGTAFDGDSDGTPNGVYNYWFRAATSNSRTLFVDKIANTPNDVTENGSLAAPFKTIPDAVAASRAGDIIRVVGNGGDDGLVSTVADNVSYEIGFDVLGRPLEDGDSLKVPRGVTLMLDAGVVIKASDSAIEVGSSSPEVDRSKAAIQVLGTPAQSVYFTSFNDESIGADTNPSLATTPEPGDWGGILIQNDVDRSTGRFEYEQAGVFLNYISHADMRYGGGSVFIDSVRRIVTPINMIDARPTVVFNEISRSADAAMSANPDSFEETNFNGPEFQTVAFSSNYARVGPNIYGNTLVENSTNGLFVRIQTAPGAEPQEMTVSGRWDDKDVVHIVAENLIIRGNPGGPVGTQISGNRNIPVEDRFRMTARLDASLVVDPGIVVKMDGARIEVGLGAQFVAEGNANQPVVFTSLNDDRFGAGGTFDSRSDGSSRSPAPGDWAGLYFGHASNASMDNAVVNHGGGVTKIEGSFTAFNVVEIHQADARITNSTFDDNFNGTGGQAPDRRFGRGDNAPGAIYVLGAQPIIVNNLFRDTVGLVGGFGGTIDDDSFAPAINIDVNSLDHSLVRDWGHTIGRTDRVLEYQDNSGALIRENLFENSTQFGNSTNGMIVRGGTLTTQSVWDDTDIVHVVLDEIVVPNFDTYGGLRLASSPTESLVVKFAGENAGLTASGDPLDITDRIGGSIHIIGHPSNPVILTSLNDDTEGAGFLNDTNSNNSRTLPAAGDWRGIVIDRFANDRNVSVYAERELPTVVVQGSNNLPATAEFVGNLAPNEISGDENRRLGFDIHGVLSQPTDVDVFSFEADAGTQVWFDIDHTSDNLDTVLELVTTTGQVMATSDNSGIEALTLLDASGEQEGGMGGLAQSLDVTNTLAGDLYSTNIFDAGMRVALPGAANTSGTYLIRVRAADGSDSSGVYKLQIRLRETDEVPGNVVSHADIKYATNGIAVLGQPSHSPLLGEQSEIAGADTIDSAQDLGAVLASDRGAISVAGMLDASTDVDWYEVEVGYTDVKSLNPDESVSVVFDIDYADGFGRPDSVLSVFNAAGQLVLFSNDSGIADDQPKPANGSDIDDTTRGSAGNKDPYIGPVQLRPGTYFVAVSSGTVPNVLNQYRASDATDTLARLEPIDSITRVGEDHIFEGNASTAANPQIPIVFGKEYSLIVPEDVALREGETITIESQAGQKVTFEFDSEGFLLFPPVDPSELVDGETVAIRSTSGELATFQLSRQGYAVDFIDADAIFDGDRIAVTVGDDVFVVEFDTNFITSPGTIPVTFNLGATTDEIAIAFGNALSARTTAEATVVEDDNGRLDKVELQNATGLTSQFSNGFVIITPSEGNAQTVPYTESQTQREIADNLALAINRSGIATATIEGLNTFRIRLADVSDVRLSLGGLTTNRPVRSGNYVIPFTRDDTAIEVQVSITEAINAAMGPFGVSAGSGFGTGLFDVDAGVDYSLKDAGQLPGGIVLTDFSSDSIPTFSTGGFNLNYDAPVPIVGLSPDSSLSISRPGSVPYTLQDVTMFLVSDFSIDGEDSTLFTYDAYSGAFETTVGPFDPPVGDIATRPTGRGSLFAISNLSPDGGTPINDSTTGNIFEISATNGDATLIGDDTIGTFIADPSSTEIPPGVIPSTDDGGVGIDYEALTFIGDNHVLAIGSRWDARDPEPSPEAVAANPYLMFYNEYRNNLVYVIDVRDGEADSNFPNGFLRDGQNGREESYFGAGTDVYEVGHIDTWNDLGGTADSILTSVEATTVNGANWTANIVDGMQIEVTDGATVRTLEFDSGPEIELNAAPDQGVFVLDGEFFIVDNQRYTFDTGVVMVVEASGATFVEGDTFSLTDSLGTTKTFEFDSDDIVVPGYIAVDFNDGNGLNQVATPQSVMIQNIVDAINSPSDFLVQATAQGNRISFTGDVNASLSASGIRFSGEYGVSTVSTVLSVEETFTSDQIGETMVNAFRRVSGITASHSGGRVNFLGATTADFENAESLIDTGRASGVSRPNYVPIGFLVEDSAATIAARVASSVNGLGLGAVLANQFTDTTVSLTNGTFDSADSQFSIGGTPTGGRVTGVVQMPFNRVGTSGDLYYAVTDTGGLFEFSWNGRLNNQMIEPRYVPTSSALTGIAFEGLTLGPEAIENGRYAETLFGIDDEGVMYAFDTLGTPMPVFANGASQVATGAVSPKGITFGLLQENLWGPTNYRFDEAGHGYASPVTLSRPGIQDGSIFFGFDSRDPAQRNYNFPGGSQGTLISNTFSLENYTSADQPFLYFNYFLDTEDALYDPTDDRSPMRDSFRVYVMDDRVNGDNGEWHLLATNNQYTDDDLHFDEFDNNNTRDGVRNDVQMLFDNVGWRQARIALDEYAGRDNLRLRFEFSTAGAVSLGNDSFFDQFGNLFGSFEQTPGLGGQEGTEIYAVPAEELRDGQSIRIGPYGNSFFGGPETSLEFDFGYTLVPPSGNLIDDGEEFTLIGIAGTVVTYEFDKNGSVADGNVTVAIRDNMSAAGVAASIDRAIVGSELGQPSIDDNDFMGTIDEANGNIRLAVDTGLAPGNSGTFTGSGEISSAVSDVDFVKFQLDAGDTVQVDLLNPTSGLSLRLFNEEGVEVQTAAVGTPFIDFTAYESGNYFAGISAAGNTFYDPFAADAGSPGLGVPISYQLQVTTGDSRAITYINDSRLNIHGLADIVQTPSASLFVDGAPGTLDPAATPILVTGNMNQIEVASAIAHALGEAYSDGETDWILRRDEMIKIAGRTVIDPGPLGTSDQLWGDFTGAFNYSWDSDVFPDGPLRGLDNEHEGVYVDDIIIGFAERGEFVVEAASDTSFILRDDVVADRTILTGPYQLEIREASQYGRPNLLIPELNLDFIEDADGHFIQQGRSFDTNDRLTDTVSLSTSVGSQLATGQTFIISDEMGAVRFEYVDGTIYEGNDVIETATKSRVIGGTSDSYVGIGQIGDNRGFRGDNSTAGIGVDVDLIELNLQENDLVVVDVDSFNPDSLVTSASTLDSAIRVFDQTGREIAFSDDDRGPGDLDVRSVFLDPAVTFRAPTTGPYYVAVSQAANISYDPNVAGSGTPPTPTSTANVSCFVDDTCSPVNSVEIIEGEHFELTGGTYEIYIDVNNGEPAGDSVRVPFATFDEASDVADRIVRAINSDETQSTVGFSAAPRQQSGIIDLYGDKIAVVNQTTSLAPESNDTIATAISANTSFGVASRFVVNGRIGDNAELSNSALDVDIFEVKIEAGDLLTVDIDAFENDSSLLAAVTIVDALGNPLVSKPSNLLGHQYLTYDAVDPLTPLDKRLTGVDPLLEFLAPTSDTYYVVISSDSNIRGSDADGFLASFDPSIAESGSLLTPFYLEGAYQAVIQIGDGSIASIASDLYGDSNVTREQGQLILNSNRILHSEGYGIVVGEFLATSEYGAVRNLPDINVTGLVPGVVIENNIIARFGAAGIQYNGDIIGDRSIDTAPFGRIVNNTIFGNRSTDQVNPLRSTAGITVSGTANPTILNNIVAEVGSGILQIFGTDQPVIGGTLFYNTDDLNPDLNPFGTALQGDFPIIALGNGPLFEDSNNNNFYLVDGAPAIDSSIDSLADRIDLTNIRDTLGIPVSPILAPDLDNAGQLRVDDPNVQTPVGQGENVFKDRGALDRADLTGPRAILANPIDNDVAGEDSDPDVGVVIVPSASLRNFTFELIDNTGNGGVGVDDTTVTSDTVEVRRDGALLIAGEDYIFEYSATNNQIRLSPVSGIWPRNSSFEIRLSNSLADLAGNQLSPNQLNGETVFVVSTDLGRDFGDAPFESSLADDGARHQIVDGYFLGTMVDNEPDAIESPDATGDTDEGVVFSGSFVPGLTTDLTVTASAPGFIDAWVDWDGDMSFDAEDQILKRYAVSTGANTIVVRAASSAASTTSYARFRFSSAGDLGPTGLAGDGEVEDYQVGIGTNPWQNPIDRFDVNGDMGPTGPLDALMVINELTNAVYANPANGRLPIPAGPDAPPPYFDVNGDGFVSPLDAVLVIGQLPSSTSAATAPLSAALTFAPIDVTQTMTVDLRKRSERYDTVWSQEADSPIVASNDAADGDRAVEESLSNDTTTNDIFDTNAESNETGHRDSRRGRSAMLDRARRRSSDRADWAATVDSLFDDHPDSGFLGNDFA